MEAGGRVDLQYSLNLESQDASYALDGVQVESYESIFATVPAGLDVGIYDLWLTSPTSDSAVLDAAFSVTDTRADHLAFEVDEVAYEVNTPFKIDFQLYDPEDDELNMSMDVTLVITGRSGVEGFEFDLVDLDDATELRSSTKVVLAGSLNSAGHGDFTARSSIPDDIKIELEPGDSSSVVDGDNLILSVEPAQLNAVEITLPSEDFQTTAGVSFDVLLQLVDTYGNPRDDVASLIISEECGSFVENVDIVGSTTLEVHATGATGTDCEQNKIYAYGTASGESAPFQVLPAAATAYSVGVFPSEVIAGEEALTAVISANDDYGNVVTDYGEDLSLTLTDTAGGLDPDSGVGWQECPGFSTGWQVCTAYLWSASDEDQLVATGTDGLTGISGSFAVNAASLDSLDVFMDRDPVLAGESFYITVHPLDEYGNSINTNPHVDEYTFKGIQEDPTCAWDGVFMDEDWRSFECKMLVASGQEQVTVTIENLDDQVSSTTDPFSVQNGELAVVSIDIADSAENVAGVPFPITIQARDAWGNPYSVHHSGADIQLEDETGTLWPGEASVDENGQAQVDVVVTKVISSDIISASQAGIDLGISPNFSIVHGDLAEFEASMDRPWAFVGTEYEITLTAQDTWSNTVTDYSGEVTLLAQNHTAPVLSITDFSDGYAQAPITFTTPHIQEVLEVVSDELDGPLDVLHLDVLDDTCGTVNASILIDGESTAVLCLAGGSASATLDASNSTGTYLTFHYLDGDGFQSRTSSDSIVREWTEATGTLVELVAFDSEACGDMDTAKVYVAEDEDQAAGPLTITSTHAARYVGSPTEGETEIQVSANTCSGDTAGGAAIYLRATLGELVDGVAGSGKGLFMLLDHSGNGTASWSVEDEIYGGTAMVMAGRLDGTAYGEIELEAIGDGAAPHVLDLDPRGTSDVSETDTVSLWFDEPMWEESFEYPGSAVSIVDSTDTPVSIDSLAYDSADLRLDIYVSVYTPLSPATETYSLNLGYQARDSAGNRLDGNWSGTYSSFAADFGNVVNSAPDIESCVPDTAVLRPDGDGVAATAEADEVNIEVAADGEATWWLLEVLDEQGNTTRQTWSSALADTGYVGWDARATDGHVVENGSYLLRVRAMDEHYNTGTACETEITVDNLIVDVQ